MVTARIVGHGSAFPPAMDHMDVWDQFFEQHYDGNRIAAKVWRSAGIETRHAVADPRLGGVLAALLDAQRVDVHAHATRPPIPAHSTASTMREMMRIRRNTVPRLVVAARGVIQ